MWVIPGQRGTPPSYGQAEYSIEERTGRWLAVASGEANNPSRVRLTQSASFFVTRLASGDKVAHTFAEGRRGFLFAAEGNFMVSTTAQNEPMLADAELHTGDAVRIAGVTTLTLAGTGEAILWDVPHIPVGLEEA